MLNFLTILLMFYTLFISFYIIDWPCYNVNDCAVWMLSWNHVTVAILILISSTTYRVQKIKEIIIEADSLAEKCIQKQIKSRKKICYYFFALLILFGIKMLIMLSSQKNYKIFILHSISYIVPLSMECVFLVICSIVEDTCYAITKTLKNLCNSSNTTLLTWNIKILMNIHQRAAKLLRINSKCFNKDLFVDLIFNMIWFIIYIYVTILSFYKSDIELKKNISLILELIFLIVRVYFLCHSVNSIEYEVC